MSDNICSPLSMPGPLNEDMDVRLALSKEALKMISTASLSLMSTSFLATVSSSSADSMTHGPAMIFVCMGCLFLLKYAKNGKYCLQRYCVFLTLPNVFHIIMTNFNSFNCNFLHKSLLTAYLCTNSLKFSY